MAAHAATGLEPASGDTWVEVGRVVRPHGLQGGLLVALWGDDPTNVERADRLQLSGDPGSIEFTLVSLRETSRGDDRERRADKVGRSSGLRVRLRVEGLESREQAQAWVGARVAIPESALEPLPAGEYYWRDLIGLECRTLQGESLGRVEEIWQTGSNDVIVVQGPKLRLLVPALRDVLARVELAEGALWIDPPAGLLEQA